jgi:hypothetical protein
LPATQRRRHTGEHFQPERHPDAQEHDAFLASEPKWALDIRKILIANRGEIVGSWTARRPASTVAPFRR